MTKDSKPIYESVPSLDRSAIEKAIIEGDIDVLMFAPLSVSLNGEDPEWAQDLCLRLARHSHFNIRGNAILGFGNIARLSGRLSEMTVKPIIEKALRDEDPFVRDQADCAKDDVEHFLGWKFKK
jgi:hypothetical protein